LGDRGGAAGLAVLLAIGAWALVLAEAWMILHLVRQQGRLLVRLDDLEAEVRRIGQPGAATLAATSSMPAGSGLRVGSPAPPFSLPGLYGEVLPLAALCSAGRPI